jgi:hypothetical protein
VTYNGPPPPPTPFIGATNFSYVNCSGVTVNSIVGDGDFAPISRNVCAQENSIVITGGDGLASWDISLVDCCTLCNVTLAYSISTSIVCTISASDVTVCMDNCDLSVATVIYEKDGIGDCTSTFAANGWYSDGIYKRNWVSGVFTGPAGFCP